MKKLVVFLNVLMFIIFSACSTEPDTTSTIETTTTTTTVADFLPPTFTIDSPTNGQIVGFAYTISGTVSDAGSGVAGVCVKSDNSSIRNAEISGTNWSIVVSFTTAGSHTNEVYAIDNRGNKSEALTVCPVCTKIPAVFICIPENHTVTNVSTITVAGAASISAPYSITSVMIKLNNGAWVGATGTDSWWTTLTLNEGTNTLIACATADNGKTNVSQAWKVVLYYDTIYLSSTGADWFEGYLPSWPKLTIDSALTAARAHGSRRIAVNSDFKLTTNTTSSNAGWYLKGLTNLTICGGWNAGFTAQGGASVLHGQNQCKHVVYLHKCSGLTLSNFVITGGYSTNAYGGGLAMYSTANSIISCIVSNNSARYGGGVYIYPGSYNTISGVVSGNTTTKSGGGGGIYIAGNYNTISGKVFDNTATNGGGVYVYTSSYNIISGTITNNTATNGGGVYISLGSYNTVSGTISRNTASRDGGGICIWYGCYNLFSGTISSNTVTSFGGGVCIRISSNNTVSGAVFGNAATGYGDGGGVYIYYSSFNRVSGFVHGNTATRDGGGIHLDGDGYNIISGIVSSNTATYYGDGGGIYVVNSHYNTISGIVSGNSSFRSGGGICIEDNDSLFNTVSGTVSGNTANIHGGGIYLYYGAENIVASTARVINNHCDNDDNGTGSGGGIYHSSIGNDYIEPGCIYSPNFKGSGTGTVDDLYGITAP